MSAQILLLPHLPQGQFCRPYFANNSEIYFAHKVVTDYLVNEGVQPGEYVIVKSADSVPVGALACLRVNGYTFIARFQITADGSAYVRTPQDRCVLLRPGRYKVLGRAVDACEGHALCKYRGVHPIAKEEAVRVHRKVAILETQRRSVFWKTDACGIVYEISSEWERLTSQTLQQVAFWGWLKRTHPEDRMAAARRWQYALLSGFPYQFASRLKLIDGRYYMRAALAIPKFDANGKIESWSGITQVGQRAA